MWYCNIDGYSNFYCRGRNKASDRGGVMHYRNGREAKNGDKIVKLDGGRIVSFGVLHSAIPGDDYCNGYIAPVQPLPDFACLVDCLHVDDLAAILAEKGIDKRPEGK